MLEMRHRHDMRSMIDRVLNQVQSGALSWRQAASTFDAQGVPFAVTCRVLRPYAG
jgi:hypothetical protein